MINTRDLDYLLDALHDGNAAALGPLLDLLAEWQDDRVWVVRDALHAIAQAERLNPLARPERADWRQSVKEYLQGVHRILTTKPCGYCVSGSLVAAVQNTVTGAVRPATEEERRRSPCPRCQGRGWVPRQ